MEARAAEAVKAADAAWLDAEINGDYKFLEWFLLDGYESVGATGSIFSRAALIENDASPDDPTNLRNECASGENGTQSREVKIYRDTAILTWVADEPSSKAPIYSCDIFIYQNRHWHAFYSQHSTAEC